MGKPEEKEIVINSGDDFPSRLAVTYTGKFRNSHKLSAMIIMLWLQMSDPTLSMEEALTITEGLFIEDGAEYWLPIQTQLISTIKAEAKEGDPIMLYVNLMGCHRSDDQTTYVLPVSEFLVPKGITESPEGTPIFCPTKDQEARNAFNQANDLRDQEKFTEAEKLFREAIELDPNFCDAMDNLGIMLRKQGKADEAIQWYQRSLEVKPDNSLALRNMGLAYYFQEKPDEAIPVFEKLVQIAPDDPEGYYGLGISHYEIEKYEDAISVLEIAELLYFQNGSPFVRDAQYYLGLSYFKLDDCARSRGYLAPIYDQLQEDIQTNIYLGICYLNEEPKDLELVKKYLLKAEALGYKLPDEWVKQLVKAFGTWPPK